MSNLRERLRAALGDSRSSSTPFRLLAIARVLVIATAVSVPGAARAQDAATLRTAFAVGELAGTSLIAAEPSPRRKFWTRTASASLLSLAGAAAGYGAAHLAGANDDDDFGVVISAAAVGALLGAATGVVLLPYDSACSRSRRFARGFGGAMLGVIPAVILGPLGPGIGATAMQGRCK